MTSSPGQFVPSEVSVSSNSNESPAHAAALSATEIPLAQPSQYSDAQSMLSSEIDTNGTRLIEHEAEKLRFCEI